MEPEKFKPEKNTPKPKPVGGVPKPVGTALKGEPLEAFMKMCRDNDLTKAQLLRQMILHCLGMSHFDWR